MYNGLIASIYILVAIFKNELSSQAWKSYAYLILIVNLPLGVGNQTLKIFLKVSLYSSYLYLSKVKGRERKQISVKVKQLSALPRFCPIKTELYFRLN
jgi:hypothetical protein